VLDVPTVIKQTTQPPHLPLRPRPTGPVLPMLLVKEADIRRDEARGQEGACTPANRSPLLLVRSRRREVELRPPGASRPGSVVQEDGGQEQG
jgi:hypothetical protein